MTQHRKPPHVTARRTVVAAVGAAGLAAAFAACGDGDSGGGSGYDAAPEEEPKEEEAPEEEKSEEPESGGKALGSASEVPVGGGKVFKGEKVVVTQPEEGKFMGFSAVCTHQGCTVGDVAGGTINCPCHGSKYAITDGSVKNGPATKPLPKVQVQAEGGKLTRG
ncbi:Rieske (2Fe-2S) protein [Streptomyces sp. A7024]|uniref:Cytochrome bc1 complex Rieske iron-sulfur subunit n=1 Tax=Streptomyces coryli TaxID=1128680 RepID=A0A6G4UDT6_9ACTN|nr:Rieske (2Fe-2S) protein [Streptomyces coryli]NGN69361.1 Rieske (2Fe-2S) protein [Streptomyces coryli]